jgi:hypothetical protein
MTRPIPSAALLAGLLALFPAAATGQEQCTPAPAGSGVLVMAHGGSPAWNAEVTTAVEPLRRCYPLEIAFGMAEPATIQEAAVRLEAAGATRIAVVRLFVSGESWRERTEQILGLRPGAPPRPERLDTAEAGHGAHHDASLWRIASTAEFRMSRQGLAESPLMDQVLVERVRALSTDPLREEVLILAHGPGSDQENVLWLEWLDARAMAVREAAPFHVVRGMTLREDWPEERVEAAAAIRRVVEAAAAAGRSTVVIPFRVQGFGPYARVLEGLPYVADGTGLLPHPAVGRWIASQAEALFAGWEAPPPGGERPPPGRR